MGDMRLPAAPDAGPFLSTLTAAVACWLLIGGISYSPAARNALGDAFAALLFLVLPAEAILVSLCADQAHELWPGRDRHATFVAGTVGLAAATLYALRASGGWAHGGQGLFWAMGGGYAGVALEAATGFWTAVKMRLEMSAGP